MELNQELINSELVLDEKFAIPHLSLAMAVIDEAYEKEISQKLQELAEQYESIELNLDHVFKNQSAEHGLVSGLGFAKSAELMNLHRAAMAVLEPYAMQVDANDKTIFANPEEINYSAPAAWVLNFSKSHAYENFDPHITIGMGTLDDLPDMEISFFDLAFYHLGKFCTCRKLISQYPFKDMPEDI